MYKALIYTDVHFCQFSSIVRKRGKKYSVRLHNLIDSLSWAENLAKENNCDEILCLGDFFDKSELNGEEITALQDVKFANIKHTFLVGNHEINIASLDFSTTELFRLINASVINKPYSRQINDKVTIDFIPYIVGELGDTEKYDLKNYVAQDDKKHIVITHNDVCGIGYGRQLCSCGFNISNILDNCSLFIDGHIHTSGIVRDRILFVGNLTGQNFNEDASVYDHVVYLMTIDDDGTITMEPIKNENAFHFYKVQVLNESDLEILNHLKNNAVVSITCVSNLFERAEQELSKHKNIIESRILINYGFESNDEFDNSDYFKVSDPIKQFIAYIQEQITNSRVLEEELSLLGD